MSDLMSPQRRKPGALQVPDDFGALASSRDETAFAGQYSSAAVLQRELERRRQEEDEKRLQVLADRQEVETLALERSQADEFSAFVRSWDQRVALLDQQAAAQEKSMLERQANEMDAFRAAAQSAMPRPKWSRDLLNLRKIEEHLARQKEFLKAAQTKTKADAMEAEEVRANEQAYWDKVSLEEAKVMHRQVKELDALRTRCTALRDEAMVTQRRELEKLSKKFQVARIELAKSQGLAKGELDWALKGWFNPRKGGLGPSPLVPASPLQISLMQPALKLNLHRGFDAGTPGRPASRSAASSVPCSPKYHAPDSPTSHSKLSSPSAASPGTRPGSASNALPSIPSALQPRTELCSPSGPSRSGSAGQAYLVSQLSPSTRSCSSPKGPPSGLASPKGGRPGWNGSISGF